MANKIMIEYLEGAIERLEDVATESGYGHFPGGDPREFFPDPECCTDEERQIYKEDCERMEKKEIEGVAPAGKQIDNMHVTFVRYGLGSYTFQTDRFEKTIAKIREAIEIFKAEVDD